MKRCLRLFAAAALIIAISCLTNGCGTGKAAIDRRLSKMTTQEKVAQLFVTSIDYNDTEDLMAEDDILVQMGLGGIIIMRGPVKPFMKRANHLQKNAKIPLLVSVDGEWGAAMRFGEYIPYPRQYMIGKIPNAEEYLYQMGLNVARELKALNIYVNYAPVADLATDNNAGAGAQRRFGLSPEQTANLCNAYMKGMQDGGIFACGKHFPGHGDTAVDSHIDRPYLTYTRAEMDTVHLVPFKKMIEEGVAFIMMGHYCIPAVDSSLVTMSNSPICVNELLRRDLGFKGIVTTDALGMGGVAKGREPLEVNIATYKAGVDMLLMAKKPVESICAIADSVEAGVFPVEDLDARVRKVLEYKQKAGFFKPCYSPRVRRVDAKIAAARKRDSALVEKMDAAIKAVTDQEQSSYDPTLQPF